MHELSLADSVLEIAVRNTPGGSVLRGVKLRAGPRRMIDREAMMLAWRAVLGARGMSGDVVLELTLEPWSLRCPGCGVTYTSDSHEGLCGACGRSGSVVGSNDLQITTIVVDDGEEKRPVAAG